jgi:hypothetical protein
VLTFAVGAARLCVSPEARQLGYSLIVFSKDELADRQEVFRTQHGVVASRDSKLMHGRAEIHVLLGETVGLEFLTVQPAGVLDLIDLPNTFLGELDRNDVPQPLQRGVVRLSLEH